MNGTRVTIFTVTAWPQWGRCACVCALFARLRGNAVDVVVRAAPDLAPLLQCFASTGYAYPNSV